MKRRYIDAWSLKESDKGMFIFLKEINKRTERQTWRIETKITRRKEKLKSIVNKNKRIPEVPEPMSHPMNKTEKKCALRFRKKIKIKDPKRMHDNG